MCGTYPGPFPLFVLFHGSDCIVITSFHEIVSVPAVLYTTARCRQHLVSCT
jgi:hypothetical protein